MLFPPGHLKGNPRTAVLRESSKSRILIVSRYIQVWKVTWRKYIPVDVFFIKIIRKYYMIYFYFYFYLHILLRISTNMPIFTPLGPRPQNSPFSFLSLPLLHLKSSSNLPITVKLVDHHHNFPATHRINSVSEFL